MAGGVFARQQSYHGGSFASDTAVFALSGQTVALGIVQNVNVTFAQNISRIYDVSNGGVSGSVPVYLVGGRTQGTAAIGRVIGPKSTAICDFYETMGNVCTPQDLVFTFSAACESDNASIAYTLKHCVTTQIGIQVSSNDMIVNENLQLMFIDLHCA